jgi:hypothetical protein
MSFSLLLISGLIIVGAEGIALAENPQKASVISDQYGNPRITRNQILNHIPS